METEIKLCECGKCGLPAPISKRTGQTRRFVCGHNSRTHNHSRGRNKTPEYRSFGSAKDRCTNPNNVRFADYGGRGIKFLFDSFEQFFAELGPRPKGKTLDRIENDGNYEPGNVQWATPTEQLAHRRPYKKAA